jgi:hypothetical protein
MVDCTQVDTQGTAVNIETAGGDSRQQTADSRQQTIDSRQETVYSRQQTKEMG